MTKIIYSTFSFSCSIHFIQLEVNFYTFLYCTNEEKYKNYKSDQKIKNKHGTPVKINFGFVNMKLIVCIHLHLQSSTCENESTLQKVD